MGFSYTLPTVGLPDTTEDVKVINALSTLSTWGNGNVDTTDVKATFAQSAGINQSGQTVKGSSIIATSQSTGSTTYTTLATPDQVTGIVLPTAGLIAVWYQATWQESVSSASSAAIFLGANQLERAGASVIQAQAATNGGTAGVSTPLTSSQLGLVSGGSGSGYPGDVTTGQLIGYSGGGGPAYMFAAAGTYTVSVQFKASSGTVTASNRRLYVLALSFG